MPRRTRTTKKAAAASASEADFSQVAKSIKDTPLQTELGNDFLKYAEMVISARALPDVRDGLKPVQRRILWAMYSAGYMPNKPTVKSLRVVAETSKFHPHGDCFHKDTVVQLLDGTTKTIRELTEEGGSHWVLAVSADDHQLVPVQAHDFRIGQWATDLYHIRFANGYELVVTSNHPFLDVDGNWVRAEDLKPWAILDSTVLTDDTGRGYLTAQSVSNTVIRKKSFVHHLVGQAQGLTTDSSTVIHHRDFNRLNNSPDNLALLTRGEHAEVHRDYETGLEHGRQAMFAEDGQYREAIREKNRRLMVAYNANQGLAKAFQALSQLEKRNLALTIENYETLRGEIYNLTRIDRMIERGTITSFDELVERYQSGEALVDTSDSIGLTQSSNSKPAAAARNQHGPQSSALKVMRLIARWGKRTDYAAPVPKEILKNTQSKPSPIVGRMTQEEYEEFRDTHLAIVESVTVEHLDEPEPMYDFTVDHHHNMLLPVSEDCSLFCCAHNSSIYESQVTLARPFVMPLTMVDIQGSVGTDWDDAPAAARYTEARLAKDAMLALEEVKESTVTMFDNYDGTEKEPEVLPVEFPLLPINGSSGIAVGLTTNIPQNNPTEVMQATRYLLFHPKATTAKLMEYIKGPDFPNGGMVMGADNLVEVYEKGQGAILLRANVEIKELRGNKHELTFTGIPYGTSVKKCLAAIRKAITDKKITEIAKSDDLSDRKHGTQLVVVTKRSANPDVVISQLYKYTPLESNFGVVCSVIDNGKPRYMGIKEILQAWIDFRREVVRNRTQHRYDKAADRMHMIGALQTILADVDEVIRIVRQSENRQKAHDALKKRYKIDDAQADYVLSISLGRLTRFDRIQLDDEAKSLKAQMESWKKILDDPKTLDKTIASEMDKVAKQIARPRKTVIVGGSVEEHKANLDEQMAGPVALPSEPCRVTITCDGQVWRQAPKSRAKGLPGPYVSIRETMTDSELLVVTNQGRSLRITTADITTKPMETAKLMSLQAGERVLEAIPLEGTWQDKFKTKIGFVTRMGAVKVLDTSTLTKNPDCDVMKLAAGDEIICAAPVADDSVCSLVTSNASLLSFDLKGVRPQGRTGGGVAGIKLVKDATVLAAAITSPADEPLVVSVTKSSTKVADLEEFPKKGRATMGVRCHKFLKGENGLVAAYVGVAPLLTAGGKEGKLPAKSKREASGTKTSFKGDIVIGRGK